MAGEETRMSVWGDARPVLRDAAGWVGRGIVFGAAAVGLLLGGALLQVAAASVGG